MVTSAPSAPSTDSITVSQLERMQRTIREHPSQFQEWPQDLEEAIMADPTELAKLLCEAKAKRGRPTLAQPKVWSSAASTPGTHSRTPSWASARAGERMYPHASREELNRMTTTAEIHDDQSNSARSSQEGPPRTTPLHTVVRPNP